VRKPVSFPVLAMAAGLAAAGLAVCLLTGATAFPQEWSPAGRLPRLLPDCSGCVIPPNVASLSFHVDEPGTRYAARAHSARGEPLEVTSRTGDVTFPARAWRALLNANRGEAVGFDVYVKGHAGGWQRFDTVSIAIAPEEIDRYLVYRLLGPVFNTWGEMSLCQRDLSGYEEKVVLRNRSFDSGCMNCHTFLNNSTEAMLVNIRPGEVDYGRATLLARRGGIVKLEIQAPSAPLPAAYMSWHPSGRVVAFSANKVRQFFHTARSEMRDVVDLDSDLGLYTVDSNTVTTAASIADPGRLETYPAWSADGRHLYFCSAPILWSDRDKVPPDRFNELRYDLVRVGYEADTGRWGALETVLSAAQAGGSVTLPRPSPDGRFLLFCISDYGCFPVHDASADLYLMDLRNGRYERLGCNSDRSESWHSWSSNSRWFVFSSKRDDDLLARPYLAYLDRDGRAHKPFVLPQRAPGFYRSFLKTYNLPELVREPIPFKPEQLLSAIRKTAPIKAELPLASPRPPAELAPPFAEEPWYPRR
jgi:hypothetical protein